MRLNVPLNQISKGPVIHEQLPNHLVSALRWIYRHVHGCLCDSTFEQFELDFCRDDDPEQEVAAWMRMTIAALEYTDRYPASTKCNVLRRMLAISMGVRPDDDKYEIDEMISLFESAPQFADRWVRDSDQGKE